MLSGYMTAGMLGLPMAAALAGSTLAAWGTGRPTATAGLVALGSVLLFSLLVAGRFFGELTTQQACLLARPLAAWLPELGAVQLSRPVRDWLRVAAVVLVIGEVVAGAGRKFAAAGAAPTGSESNLEDYYNYGK